MRRSVVAIVLLQFVLIALLSGCADSKSTASTKQLLSVERTGGFAYSEQKLTIAKNGEAKLSTLPPPGNKKSRTFKVSAKDLKTLNAVLNSVHLSELKAQPSACSDCWVYKIKSSSGSATVDDASIPNELQPLTTTVNRLISKHGA